MATSTYDTPDSERGQPEGRLFHPSRSERLSTGSRIWHAVSGVAFLLAAVFALVQPFIASLAANVWLGFVLVALGIVEVFSAFRRRGPWSVIGEAAVGVLAIIGGVLAIAFPLAGLMAFTTVMIALFLLSGGVRIAQALRRRPHGLWLAHLVSGLIAVALGLMILFYLPVSALVALGTILAVDLVVFGAILLATAAWGKAPPKPPLLEPTEAEKQAQ